jgi:hypothetical protein
MPRETLMRRENLANCILKRLFALFVLRNSVGRASSIDFEGVEKFKLSTRALL